MSIDQIVRSDLIRAAIGPVPRRILEVGCGDGNLSSMLASHGHTVFACDVPTPFDKPRAPHFFLADGCHLPVGSGLFDCTISSEVLEHIQPEGRTAFLRELLRVTRPNGTVVLTAFIRKTLSFRIYGAAWLIASGCLPVWYCEHAMIPTPSPEDIRGVFSSSSGKIVSYREFMGPLGLLCTWVQNATKLDSISKAGRLLPRIDRLGRKISCMVIVEKLAG